MVDWIAAQQWSDGKIGTFGTSYPGGTQHALAETKPPHLTTMVPDRCAVQLWGEWNAARRCVRVAVHELDLPDRSAQQQGSARQPHLRQALVENGRGSASTPTACRSARERPAAGRARVRGLAGRSDEERTRVAVLAHQGNVGRRSRQRLRRRPRLACHWLVRLVDAPGHDELRGAGEGQEIARSGW